jgi:hypothetical protein
VRVLDEVAEAVQLARGGRLPRPVRAGERLDDLIGAVVTGERWAAAERHLGCPLPPVAFVQGHWFLPDEFETVWDVADHVARHRPDWNRRPHRPRPRGGRPKCSPGCARCWWTPATWSPRR